jgi:hypothetical protein
MDGRPSWRDVPDVAVLVGKLVVTGSGKSAGLRQRAWSPAPVERPRFRAHRYRLRVSGTSGTGAAKRNQLIKRFRFARHAPERQGYEHKVR